MIRHRTHKEQKVNFTPDGDFLYNNKEYSLVYLVMLNYFSFSYKGISGSRFELRYFTRKYKEIYTL